VTARRRAKRVTPQPARAADAPADPNAWKLKVVIEEDEELSARRFTVWIAPAGDSGYHLCIGSGATRAEAVSDAETELRGAVGLLGKGVDRPACEKCGWRKDLEAL
jgi:hypothetical protein